MGLELRAYDRIPRPRAIAQMVRPQCVYTCAMCILPRVAIIGTRNPRDRRVQRVRRYVNRLRRRRSLSELPAHGRGFRPPTTGLKASSGLPDDKLAWHRGRAVRMRTSVTRDYVGRSWILMLVAIQLIASIDHRSEIAPSAPEGRLLVLVPGQRRHAREAEPSVVATWKTRVWVLRSHPQTWICLCRLFMFHAYAVSGCENMKTMQETPTIAACQTLFPMSTSGRQTTWKPGSQ
jgi:hypothetical protein